MINNKNYPEQVSGSVKTEAATIRLNDFKLLPYYEQLACLLDNGTYLATRHYEEYKINTYHLPTFFAEVWYDNKSNEVAGIRAFSNKD